MAKSFPAVALFASAVCFAALLGFAQCTKNTLYVEGRVYCDTCRVQFETKLSENLGGAKVRLECRNRENGKLNYTVEGVTRPNGTYCLTVEGEHEEEICEVQIIKSPREDCNEISDGLDKARVLLTRNDGVSRPMRFANPLGFMKKAALGGCSEVLKELGFLPLSLEDAWPLIDD